MKNLRHIAEDDLKITLEDDQFGFGIECLIDDPDGNSDTFVVQSGDVHLLFDTDTGVPVNNRTAHIAIRIASLYEKGFALPKRQPDESKNIWKFTFQDVNGVLYKFTVADTMPDRTLGIITVILELLKDAA